MRVKRREVEGKVKLGPKKKCSSPRRAAGANSVSLDINKHCEQGEFILTIVPADHPVSFKSVNEGFLVF